jgi:hypothetical protein
VSIGADGFDDADRLMPHGPAAGNGFKLLVGPEITSADAGTRDTNDCIGWFHELGIRHVLNPIDVGDAQVQRALYGADGFGR